MKRKVTQASSRQKYALRRHLYTSRRYMKSAPAAQASADAGQGSANQEQVAGLQEEITQLREMIVRQRAEFDNFRKRTQREKDQIRETAAEVLLGKLLPVMDNFDRALLGSANATEVKAVRDGVQMIFTQLQRVLDGEGLKQVEALNCPFDPNQHDAIASEEREDVADNHVCEVLLPGYLYKERLLRPAMVKVARNTARAGVAPTAAQTESEN